ncbi:MAG: hypothetical protein J2P18_02525 [Nocardia sp.]|nr:hypothetical protein [Nocardia sp.]
MHTFETMTKSLGEVALVALLLGGGLPLIFAVGVRFWATETAGEGGALAKPNPVLQAIAYICFGIVAVAVLLGIIYVAKDFISHTFHIQLFGAKKAK